MVANEVKELASETSRATGDITPMYHCGMGIARLGVRIAGLRPSITGKERIDRKGKYLFLSNHLSNLDTVMLLPEIPVRIAVFIKRPLMRIPILGYCMRLAGFIPVDRRGDGAGEHRGRERQRSRLPPHCPPPIGSAGPCITFHGANAFSTPESAGASCG